MPEDMDEYDIPEDREGFKTWMFAMLDQADLAELVNELKSGISRVFFYAASGFDWQPLHRFSHLCDCFVYVDPRATLTERQKERNNLEQTSAGPNLATFPLFLETYLGLPKGLGNLAEMRNEPWAQIPDLSDRPVWGALEKLHRRVGGKVRIIWLVFIAGSPLVAYKRLFIDTGTAPVCLAINTPQSIEAAVTEAVVDPPHGQPLRQQWAEFAGWNGELGQLIRQNNALLPKLLVADNIMDWPTRSLRYRIPTWRNADVYSMSNEAWPNVAPTTQDGRRRVIVTRKPLNPHSARSVDAVVVTENSFRSSWPVGVLAILNSSIGHVVPDGVVNLNIEGQPLLQALNKVEAVCVERGISTVAIQGLPGFEDEADDLAWWRQQDGLINKLILHLECDGHFIDFAQAADEID